MRMMLNSLSLLLLLLEPLLLLVLVLLLMLQHTACYLCTALSFTATH
jgi:hypothetical protein